MRITNAIVRRPGRSIARGLTSANLGTPLYELALSQHQYYCEILENCGVSITELTADEDYPDATFVEDTAVLTKDCAIITNPGAASRKGEIKTIQPVLENFYDQIEFITSPGTLEGGDVMNVDDHYYIGLSARTNQKGAEQFVKILEKYGMTGTLVSMKEMLHLKTGVAYLGDNNLVVAGEFCKHSLFDGFNRIKIPETETYAANCLNINDKILLPKGFEETRKMIEIFGYETIVLPMTEFQKVDGGLSCLSLRFAQK